MNDPIGAITTIAIGLYAGSLLTEGMVLVPFWRKMEPAMFYRLHTEVGPSLFRYFAPITTIAVILSIVAAITAPQGQIERMIAASLCLIALGVFFVYFSAANKKFAAHALADQDLASELKKWQAWHHFRTAAVLGAFVVSVLA